MTKAIGSVGPTEYARSCITAPIEPEIDMATVTVTRQGKRFVSLGWWDR